MLKCSKCAAARPVSAESDKFRGCKKETLCDRRASRVQAPPSGAIFYLARGDGAILAPVASRSFRFGLFQADRSFAGTERSVQRRSLENSQAREEIRVNVKMGLRFAVRRNGLWGEPLEPAGGRALRERPFSSRRHFFSSVLCSEFHRDNSATSIFLASRGPGPGE